MAMSETNARDTSGSRGSRRVLRFLLVVAVVAVVVILALWSSWSYMLPAHQRPSLGRIFFDDFSDGSTGNWTLTTSGGPITVDTSTGQVSAPSLNLSKQQRLGATQAFHKFREVTSGNVSAEANLKVNTTSSWKWCYFNLLNRNGSVETYFGLVDGQMQYYAAGAWHTIGASYAADTWYSIGLDVNLGAGIYDIYVNGVLKKLGAPLSGQDGHHAVNAVGLQAGTTNDLYGMTMWADDVLVSA